MCGGGRAPCRCCDARHQPWSWRRLGRQPNIAGAVTSPALGLCRSHRLKVLLLVQGGVRAQVTPAMLHMPPPACTVQLLQGCACNTATSCFRTHRHHARNEWCLWMQLLFNAPDGVSRLALEHRQRPTAALRAVFLPSPLPCSSVTSPLAPLLSTLKAFALPHLTRRTHTVYASGLCMRSPR